MRGRDGSGSLVGTTLTLAAGNLVNRALGLLYRFLLARWLGGEGLGLFQVTMSLYMALVQPFAASLPAALAQVLAAGRPRLGPGPDARRTTLQVVAASLGLVVTIGLLLARLPPGLLGDGWRLAASLLPLSLLPATLACAVVSAVLRGLLLAYQWAAPIALAQTVEQLVRLATVGLAVALWDGAALPLPQRFGVVIWNLLLGELADLLVLAAVAARLLARPWPLRGRGRPARFAAVARMAVPIALQRGFFALEHLAEAALIPLLLRRAGLSLSEALAAYGALSGLAAPLLGLPMFFVGAMGQALIPGVAAADRPEVVARRVRRALAVAAEVGAATGLLLLLAGPELVTWMYGADVGVARLAAEALAGLAPAAPFLYVDATTAAVLRGLGLAALPLAVDVLAACLRLGLLVLLVGGAGLALRGVTLAVVAGVAVACLLDLALVARYAGPRAVRPRELLPAPAAALAAWALLGPVAPALPVPLRVLAGGLLWTLLRWAVRPARGRRP